MVRPWSLQAPGLGRPRHLETVRFNRDLLDIGLGRLAPHPRHAAEVTRYLVAPALSLADLGSYALVLVGLGRAVPALTALGLVERGAVPPAPGLLRQPAERSAIDLSEHGRRKLGVLPIAEGAVIGRQIGSVIGELIGSVPEHDVPFNASGTPETPKHAPRPIIPGNRRDSSDSSSPPPSPLRTYRRPSCSKRRIIHDSVLG
jgi:hypothetical protein